MNASIRKWKGHNQKRLRRSFSYIPEIFIWNKSSLSCCSFHLRVPVCKFSGEFAYLSPQGIKSNMIGARYVIRSNSCCLPSVFETVHFYQRQTFIYFLVLTISSLQSTEPQSAFLKKFETSELFLTIFEPYASNIKKLFKSFIKLQIWLDNALFANMCPVKKNQIIFFCMDSLISEHKQTKNPKIRVFLFSLFFFKYKFLQQNHPYRNWLQNKQSLFF